MTADLAQRLRLEAERFDTDATGSRYLHLLREAADAIDSLRDTLQRVMDQKSREEVGSSHQISELTVALALGVSTSTDLYSSKQTGQTYRGSDEMKGSDNAADLNSQKNTVINTSVDIPQKEGAADLNFSERKEGE